MRIWSPSAAPSVLLSRSIQSVSCQIYSQLFCQFCPLSVGTLCYWDRFEHSSCTEGQIHQSIHISILTPGYIQHVHMQSTASHKSLFNMFMSSSGPVLTLSTNTAPECSDGTISFDQFITYYSLQAEVHFCIH